MKIQLTSPLVPNSTYILIQVHDLSGVAALLYVINQFYIIPNWIKKKKKKPQICGKLLEGAQRWFRGLDSSSHKGRS